MTPRSREEDIKLLVAKFVKLVESLNPGERLSIRKVSAPPRNKKRLAAKAAVKNKKSTGRK
jgi:hypothetical protein